MSTILRQCHSLLGERSGITVSTARGMVTWRSFASGGSELSGESRRGVTQTCTFREYKVLLSAVIGEMLGHVV